MPFIIIYVIHNHYCYLSSLLLSIIITVIHHHYCYPSSLLLSIIITVIHHHYCYPSSLLLFVIITINIAIVIASTPLFSSGPSITTIPCLPAGQSHDLAAGWRRRHWLTSDSVWRISSPADGNSLHPITSTGVPGDALDTGRPSLSNIARTWRPIHVQYRRFYIRNSRNW